MTAVAEAMVRTALAYAAAGWPVFPCKPGSKEPATDHGFKDASVDPDVIRWWWQRTPDANVAIATGAPGPDVLDVDVKPEGSGFAAFNRLKSAGLLTGARALVKTRSGGLHAYYSGTEQPCGRLTRHYLDFKARGGYVIAPPSKVDGRPYELLDHRIANATLEWAKVRRLLEPPPSPPRHVRRTDPGQLPAWLIERLDATDVPDRSAHFHGVVAACHHAGLTEQDTVALLTPWCEATGKYVGRVEAEVARSWSKVGRRA